MKRLYIGIALLAVMLALGIVLTMVFTALHAPLTETLEKAQTAAAAGDWETATRLVSDAKEDWTGFRHFAAAVADHEPLEQMDCLFARLEVLGRLRETDEFAAGCAELARLSTAMADSQKLTWWNLL